MAAVIFQRILRDHALNINQWHVESAGCWAYANYPASEHAISIASRLGLDLTHHRAQGVTESLLTQFDLILCMELNHKRTLHRNFPALKHTIYLLSEMAGNNKEIQDPIGLSRKDYLQTAKTIQHYLEEGLENIIELTH